MFDHLAEDKSLFIQKRYPISDQEYGELDKKYGKLCWFAASKLAGKQHRTPEDLDDFHAEIQIGMCRAGSYYKRQTFIEKAFDYLDQHKLSKDDKSKINDLKEIWFTKKSAFTEDKEDILRAILDSKQKETKEIDGNVSLEFDEKFKIYCKAIIWNTAKALGQQISKENSARASEMSLDECPFIDEGTKDQISAVNNMADLASIRNKLKTHQDTRVVQTFDILTDPDNYDEVFKQHKDDIKINIVRKKTRMSYRTINKMLSIIKKTVKNKI
jgi:hypothetical protein